MKVNNWDFKIILVENSLTGERVEYEKIEFRLDKFRLDRRGPITIPDKRKLELLIIDAKELIESQGYKILDIRKLEPPKPSNFQGMFFDIFEAYVRK